MIDDMGKLRSIARAAVFVVGVVAVAADSCAQGPSLDHDAVSVTLRAGEVVVVPFEFDVEDLNVDSVRVIANGTLDDGAPAGVSFRIVLDGGDGCETVLGDVESSNNCGVSEVLDCDDGCERDGEVRIERLDDGDDVDVVVEVTIITNTADRDPFAPVPDTRLFLGAPAVED